MSMEQSSSAGKGEPFVVSRVLDAPQAKVWKAWTEKEALETWWGPKGLTVSVAKLDLRLGGVFHYGMRAPDGRLMWGKFAYREVVPPQRIVFVVSFTDEQGTPIRHPFSSTWPLEVLSSVHLELEGDRTKLTMSGIPINATEEECKTFAGAHEGMRQGWAGTLEQLAAYLSK
jgi:uncharacterized protein YndB with AHSA1/START domain